METALDARALIGRCDVLLMTFDTLRYDVAEEALARGETPNLAALLPAAGWARCDSPGSFTYAAHAAFFAGFLPTPRQASPGRRGPDDRGSRERTLALAFDGSETIGERTCVLEGASIPEGLRARGYHTICIGGTGFFNPQTPLGAALPSLFDEHHYSASLGVTDPRSTEHQVALSVARLAAVPPGRRVFLFVNVSALHQPNCHYVPGATRDSIETQRAALRYVDGQLPPLVRALRARGPVLAILCSDHGTCYGEDGLYGHRVAHPNVWTVPYAEALWPAL